MPRTRVFLAAVSVALLAGQTLAPASAAASDSAAESAAESDPASAQAKTVHALCSKNVPLPMAVGDPTGTTGLDMTRRGFAVCLVY